MSNVQAQLKGLSGGVLAAVFILLLPFILLLTMAEAFFLMVSVGAVWHETGWLQPISYAGSLVTVWLLYTIKVIWGSRHGQTAVNASAEAAKN